MRRRREVQDVLSAERRAETYSEGGLTVIRLKEKYVVDESGKKKAVLLDMDTYRKLLDHLEKLEDAQELDEARCASESVRSYEDIRRGLKQAGRQSVIS